MIVDTIDSNDIVILHALKNRKIKYAFHDVDGTHSLIRNWQPVSSRILHDIVVNGIPENLTSEDNINRLVSLCGIEPLPEEERFGVQTAGLSILTQLEWSIRRHQQEINSIYNTDTNSKIIQMIWEGIENFEGFGENIEYTNFLKETVSKIAWVFEEVLNRYCRDKNINAAKKDPEKFRVAGSMEFLKYLKSNGIKNYFITGAVIEKNTVHPNGMFEEILALGYEIGEGKLIEDVFGSTPDKKVSKIDIMENLIKQLKIKGENVLVIGDGMSEISAGVKLGAVTISVAPKNATFQRELHKKIGADMIIVDYTSKDLRKIIK